jgi:sugar-specific transcriptional regulator TrmB
VEESSPTRPAVPAATQVTERERRARLRAHRYEEVWEQPAPETPRRSTRAKPVKYVESSPEGGSSSASGSLFVSPSSEGFSPSPRKVASPRGTKRKRAAAAAAAAKDEEDEDEEMADASSRSRSITPAPTFKIHSKRRTTLADSDDEISEKAKSRSLSRSATPAPPPVKRRKVEGKRKVVLEDSDDEME